MTSQIKELTGIYPKTSDTAQTEEYGISFKKAIKNLDDEWKPVDAAAEVVYKKLDRPHECDKRNLEHTLKKIKQDELDKLKRKIETESCMAYNLRRVGEIITLADTLKFTPLLLTRYIRYLKEWESWSLGAGEDHGSDLVTKSEFSQALDFSLGEEIARLGVAGEITPLKGRPQLRIRTASLRLMEKPKYETLIDYLENEHPSTPTNESIHMFTGEKWAPNLRGFYLDTQISADDFIAGKPVVECWKKSTLEEITRPYSTQEEGYLQFVRGVKQIARVINSQIGKVPYDNKENSAVHYDSKTGKPVEAKNER